MSILPTGLVAAPLPPVLLAELRAIFGDRLHLGEAMRAQHGASEAHFDTVLPDAVVFPHSTEEVVALVELLPAASANRTPPAAALSTAVSSAALTPPPRLMLATSPA